MASFLALPSSYGPKTTTQERNVVNVVNGIMLGRTNNTGSITLAENAATTVVTLPSGLLGADTIIFFSPTTANAATEYAAGTMFVSSRDVTNNTFTITHVNNAQTDRTFSYALIG